MKVFDAEYKLMEIIWENESINSTELVKMCELKLGWKKSTTYTNIRRLVDRNVIRTENAIVSYILSRDEVRVSESKSHLDKLYNGSLKMFLASFLEKEKISEEEAKELKKLIDRKIIGGDDD